MFRFSFVLVIILTCAACATGPTRKKANLAVDSEQTPPPTKTEGSDSTATSSDDAAPSGTIDLGFEGGTGPVKVEAAMTPEGEDAALAAQSGSETKKKDDKKKKDGEGDEKTPAKDDSDDSDDDGDESDDDSGDESYGVGDDE